MVSLEDGAFVKYLGKSDEIELYDHRCNKIRFLQNGEIGVVRLARELTVGEPEHEIKFNDLATDYIESELIFTVCLENFQVVEDFQ